MRRWPLLSGVLIGLVALFWGLASSGPDAATAWAMAARYTARGGFFLLLVVYVARPLVQLAPGKLTKALLRDRRWWGLGFAASHTIHLAALIEANRLAGTTPEMGTLVGGGLAYVLLYAMVATSTDRAQAIMGVWWKRLHRLGIHYLWFIFAFSYFNRLFDPERAGIGLVLFPIALAAGLIRLAAWLRTRRPTRSAECPAG